MIFANLSSIVKYFKDARLFLWWWFLLVSRQVNDGIVVQVQRLQIVRVLQGFGHALEPVSRQIDRREETGRVEEVLGKVLELRVAQVQLLFGTVIKASYEKFSIKN